VADVDTAFERWRQRIERLISEHPLQIVSWEATRRCNLRCVHCGSPTEDADHGQELSADEVVAAFDQIASDFDLDRFRHINITGGEPFVREDLLDILQRLSRHPPFRNIDIQTNGLVLAERPELLAELRRWGVTGLGVSIDGMERTHDVFRRRVGGFRKAFRAAQLAVDQGYVVTVSVVAHAKNVHEIPELYALVRREIRPRVFRIMTLDPIGRTGFDSKYLLSSEQLCAVINFLRDEYARSCHTYGDQKATMVELGCGGWLGRDIEGTIRPFIFHCIAGINNLGILYDGKLASCSNIPRDFIEGDLRTEPIRDVWENRYQRYRTLEWKRVGPCQTCDEWRYCHGGPMHKRLPNGSMTDCLLRCVASCPPEWAHASPDDTRLTSPPGLWCRP